MGYYVYMDENGDAEGNYSLVSLCDIDLWRINNIRDYSSQGTAYISGHGTKMAILKNELSFTFDTNIIIYLSQMIKEKRTKHYGLCPTGTFQKSSGSKNSLFTLPELQLTRNIDWPGSSVPRAVPLCGFEVQYLSKTTI